MAMPVRLCLSRMPKHGGCACGLFAFQDEGKRTLTWKIGKIPPNKTPHLSGSLQAKAGLPPAYPTVQAKFRVPGFNVSGVKIDGLTIVNTVPKPYKGVRSITKAGNFLIRTNPR